MANFTVNPQTGILIPTPGLDPGPEYATFVSDALDKLSNLTHTGAANLDGYQIPTDGINIDKDLSAQGHNIVGLRSTRYNDQANVLVGSGDVDCVYFKSGDLWINNGSGTPVKVTSGSIVNVSSSNNYPSLTISNNHTINASDVDVLFNCNATSNTIALTLPIASSVPTGRFYMVKDTKGKSETHNITIFPAGANTIDSGSSWVIDDNYVAAAVVSDGVSNWLLFLYDRKLYNQEVVKFTGKGSGITLDADGIINNAGVTYVRGLLAYGEITTSGPTYNVPATSGGQTVILCNTGSNAITVNLPDITAMQSGMTLIIKDLGNAFTNNITVTPNGANSIEGLNLSKKIIVNYGQLTLVSQYPSANNWMIF